MKATLGVQIALVAVVAVLSFFGGQRVERSAQAALRASGGGQDDRSGGGSASRGGDRGGVSRDGDSSFKGTPAARIRMILAKFEESPMVMMDFDTTFEAYDLLRDMSPAEVQIALEELAQSDASPQIKMMVQMMLINRWAKEDGKGAVIFAMEQDQPQMKMMGVMGGLMGWIKQDPDAAYAWYEENRETAGRGMMMGGAGLDGMFFNALAQRDLPGAFERVKKLNAKGQRDAINSMAGSVSGDPVKRAAFMELLEGVEDEKVKKEAVQRVLQSMAWQDPKEAVKFYESREWDDGEREQMISSIAGAWSQSDPAASLAWQMEGAKDGEVPASVGDSYAKWARSDPERAETWLSEQPEAVRTDDLYRTTANQLMGNQEYQRSIDYALRIAEPDQRTEKVKNVYTQWKQNDAEGADQWLGAMDAETQEAILAGDETSVKEEVIVE